MNRPSKYHESGVYLKREEDEIKKVMASCCEALQAAVANNSPIR